MIKKRRNPQRREDSLTRDRIIEAAIALLDESGEDGLTFRALSERLATGAGAIYWHVANKSDLLTAACDTIIARTMAVASAGATAEAALRDLALGMFDAIDDHPWVGSALMRAPGELPIIRLVESITRQVHALGTKEDELWAIVSALLNYILGVAGRNAANGQMAKTRGLVRSDFLDAVSAKWSQLDPQEFPFARSLAGQIRVHDDRADFLAGIHLILGGMESRR